MTTTLEEIKRSVDYHEVGKMERKEFEEYREKIRFELDPKVNLSEVQEALDACQKDIQNRVVDIKAEIREYVKEVEEVLDSKKADQKYIDEALESKANADEIEDSLLNKSSLEDMEAARETLKQVQNILSTKLDQKVHRQSEQTALETLSNMKTDLERKANIKDVCLILDQKPNIDDVNKALTEIHTELDTKASEDQFQLQVKEQNSINDLLCSENCTARWLWKSGSLKNGFAVPWEIQATNTCPENFLWEQENTSIMTVTPGLYEISFGFFAKKKPTVQLLVNGEACLSAVNSASYVIHHSSGKMKSNPKHSAGNISGLTMTDFIALPAKARLSISYSGEVGAEGFFGIRKL